MRSVLVAAAMLAATSLAPAQTEPITTVEHMSFDRPEAWALKYFTAVTTFTPMGPPTVRAPGSVDIGVELGWVPRLSDDKRRVGFDGSSLEDLNKTPLIGRPRLSIGLPGGVTAEVGWIPPIELKGAKANLVAAALERPFFEGAHSSMGLRIYGQLGHVKGDFTCSKDVASLPPGSEGNPLGCEAPSRDTSTLNNAGAALTGGVRFGGGATLHVAGGATYNDVQFQVGARTNGIEDHTLLITHGWTGWVAAGGGVPLSSRAAFALEAFYSPLSVRRPPREDSRNDALFNVRALLRYRFR